MGQEKILVIGDWFIDENWLMAKTDNYHSTDVGDAHYSSLIKGPTDFVLSVCGVAGVLKILSGSETGDEISGDRNRVNELIKDRFDLMGVGAWNPRDTEIIQRILCAKNPHKRYVTPYTLTNNLHQLLDGCEVDDEGKGCVSCGRKNYKLLNLVREGIESEENVSTNRIYRIYEGFGSDKPKLRYRFDWQIDLNEAYVDTNWTQEIKDVKAVVIVDHGKGVITDTLIDTLLDNFGDSRWFVRTKLDSPFWFKKLVERKKKLKLLVIDQQLVNHRYGLRKWQRNGCLCRGSLELLGQLLGLETYRHGWPKSSDTILSENVAVLFEDNWAIGGSRKMERKEGKEVDGARIYYFPKQSEKERAIRVGRTSIFFNSLIFWDLMVEDLEAKTPSENTQLSRATTWALRNMEKWMDQCTEAWKKEDEQALSGPFASVTAWHSTSHHVDILENEIQGEDYQESWKKWNQSSTKTGALDISSTQELHLWRSYGTLDHYVCPGGTKRSSINDLVRSLNLFDREVRPRFPLNALLISEPGWGKSYLAKCLADHFDFDLLSYSIAQMSSTRELVDSFKEIASTQKRSKKKSLVFMDEIDAKISGQTALGLLLSPMWDGLFKSEGYTNKIDPCIWIFACTKPLGILTGLTKGRDFLSRINGPTINIDFLDNDAREKLHDIEEDKSRRKMLNEALCYHPGDSDDDRRTEIVYQTVNFLNREYGPIAEIESDVLDLFYKIFPVNGVRSIQIFVSKFKNIKKGVIRKCNVPKLKDNMELDKQIRLIDQKSYERIFLSTVSGAQSEVVKIQLDVAN